MIIFIHPRNKIWNALSLSEKNLSLHVCAMNVYARIQITHYPSLTSSASLS